MEVIETVLRVNGFSLNLENILACLDELKIGATVQLGNNFPGGTHAPKSFIPSVQFRLPQKVTIGPMLKKFYAEIESYESIIAEFKTDPEEKTNYREKDRRPSGYGQGSQYRRAHDYLKVRANDNLSTDNDV
ncbi:MAG: hypothetical protein P8Y42_09325 [Exilibacterium sp.]